jgi:hypothetical protein
MIEIKALVVPKQQLSRRFPSYSSFYVYERRHSGTIKIAAARLVVFENFYEMLIQIRSICVTERCLL